MREAASVVGSPPVGVDYDDVTSAFVGLNPVPLKGGGERLHTAAMAETGAVVEDEIDRSQTMSHVTTSSASMSQAARRPTRASMNFGLIPKPGRLTVSMSRAIPLPAGMLQAAT